VVSFYDTRMRAVVPFEPLVEGRVSMYVCGPTVYDAPHIGHARTALTFDMVRRYLQWRGFEVVLVSNITDIDDKIINRAAEAGTTEPELAARYEQIYIRQMDRFGIARPDHRPHATEYVDQMLEFISDLVNRGAAYPIKGKGVYFSVAAHDRYGDLIGRTPEELREGAGARVEVDADKTDPLDFALWKAAKPHEPAWDSPWGPGRPGWHIECVAMATDLLGETFDIHGGGDDLAFPHHPNEVAEAEGAGLGFARHWIHGAMPNANGAQLAQSLRPQDDPGVEIGAGVTGGCFILGTKVAGWRHTPSANPLAEAVGGVVLAADLKGGKDLVVIVQRRSAPGEFSPDALMAQEKGATTISGLLESGGGVHGFLRLGPPTG